MTDNTNRRKIRVLVVDDSVLMGKQIEGILQEDKAIEVIGRAKDGMEALKMTIEHEPDVITLDVEMPRMNGITALKHIMIRHGIPTIMISALTQEGAVTTFEALKFGAVDVIAKPSRRENESLAEQRADIINKVKRAAAIRSGRSRYIRVAPQNRTVENPVDRSIDANTRFIGVGAGTGGYYSLLRIIPALPADFRHVLIAVVLVAPRYVEPFVAYLSKHSSVPVENAKLVHNPRAGTCYIASGHDGLVVADDGFGNQRFVLQGGTPEYEREGAIDRLFESLAEAVGDRAVGVVMSGAGRDGAVGVGDIRRAGGMGIVQDITDCMDPSMPLAVLQHGAVEEIVPDFAMADLFANVPSARAGAGA